MYCVHADMDWKWRICLKWHLDIILIPFSKHEHTSEFVIILTSLGWKCLRQQQMSEYTLSYLQYMWNMTCVACYQNAAIFHTCVFAWKCTWYEQTSSIHAVLSTMHVTHNIRGVGMKMLHFFNMCVCMKMSRIWANILNARCLIYSTYDKWHTWRATKMLQFFTHVYCMRMSRVWANILNTRCLIYGTCDTWHTWCGYENVAFF